MTDQERTATIAEVRKSRIQGWIILTAEAAIIYAFLCFAGPKSFEQYVAFFENAGFIICLPIFAVITEYRKGKEALRNLKEQEIGKLQ